MRSLGPLRVQGCPGGHACWDRVLPQPRVQATPPYSLGVLRSRGTQADGHGCPAAAGPGHRSGSPFHLLPCPRRPYRKDRQTNQPCAQAASWGGWSRCSPVLSPSLPRNHKASSQRRGAGWSQQCRQGLKCSPSQPPASPPTPSEHCAEPHLRPPSPRSASRPKAKSGLSRTHWSECPWQSFLPPGDLGGWGVVSSFGEGRCGSP